MLACDDEADIFDNLSRKHNEQIPGDCLCLGCFLQLVVRDDLFRASIMCLICFILCSFGQDYFGEVLGVCVFVGEF